jgi:nitrite reductase (NO-forming)
MKHLKITILCIAIIVSTGLLSSCSQSSNKFSVFDRPPKENINNLKHVTEKLVPPPNLPEYEQVDKNAPEVVEVKLTVHEEKKEIAPGVSSWVFAYNGTVPGPIIVLYQYDYLQLTLINPSTNTLEHNIDFHAATGALGGGAISHVAPGQQVTFRFRAIKPGVFVYHCAPGGIMVPLHVVSGMNGAIMVLPRDGLKDENGNPIHYDKAYYVAEQDYYIPKDKNGEYEQFATPAEEIGALMKSIRTLTPSHIVFNGSVNALTNDNALTANVGDKVLFITSSANRDTRIHIIGGHADLYWVGGSFSNKPLTSFETWPVAGGTAVAALYEFRQPGTYLYLDHNLIEAFSFGAMAEVKVEGKWNNDLMKEVQKAGPIK